MTEELADILQPISQALEADGYRLSVSERGSDVYIGIEAGPDACEECLSPPEVLISLISGLLTGSGRVDAAVHVRYPADWSGGRS